MIMTRKISVYTDRSFLKEGEPHVQLLYPFWWKEFTPYDKWCKHEHAFDNYMDIGKDLYDLVSSPEHADIFLLPWKFIKKEDKSFQYFSKLAKHHNKKLVVFNDTDDNSDMHLDNVILFRTWWYASNHKWLDVYGMPYWTSDYFKEQSFFATDYTTIPSIGYSGYINYIWYSDAINYYIKKFLKRILWYPNEFRRDIRWKAIRMLTKSDKINLQFSRRSHFWWQKKINDTKFNWYTFMENIVSCNYNLAIRWNWNWSIRFYEILHAGRVPVLLDTDCILPFQGIIDRDKYLIRVLDLNEIIPSVLKFHEGYSENQNKIIQRNIRKMYKKYLTPEWFFDHIRVYFTN